MGFTMNFYRDSNQSIHNFYRFIQIVDTTFKPIHVIVPHVLDFITHEKHILRGITIYLQHIINSISWNYHEIILN